MRHHAHWKPKNRKEDMADDVRAWVQRTSDAAAQLPTLTRISTADLTALMLAVHRVDDDQPVNRGCRVCGSEPGERPLWCNRKYCPNAALRRAATDVQG